MYDFESFQSCDTDDQKLENESVNQAIVENPVTFHCGRCNTVWADSRGICGEATSVNSLICLGEGLFLFQHDNAPVYKAMSIQKWFVEIGVEELDRPAQRPDLNPIKHLWDEVTQDVIINSEREWSLDGLFSACVYNTLQCVGCLCPVGVILYSTPEHLSALRNLFLLKKDQMYCYIFSTGQMVKASTLDFSVAPLGERLSELRQLIQEMESHLSNVSAVMDDTRTNEGTSSVQ